MPAGDGAVTPVKIEVGAVTTDNVTIENTKQSVPGLPLTGANGMLFGGIAAFLVVAGGAALVLRRRNKA